MHIHVPILFIIYKKLMPFIYDKIDIRCLCVMKKCRKTVDRKSIYNINM